MTDKSIIVNKDDLRELLVDYTSEDRFNQSKFWGSVMDAQKSHTRLLDEHTATIAQIHTDIALMKQSQVRQEETQEEILRRVTIQNGKTATLEGEVSNNKSRVKGLIAGVSISGTIILSIASYLALKLIGLSEFVSANIGTVTK